MYYSKPAELFKAFIPAVLILYSTICSAGDEFVMDDQELQALAQRYASAWSSQEPSALAAFYAEDGLLQVNDGEPAAGRAAIEAKARGFMEAFPDMLIRLESVETSGGKAIFNWLWTGTNTGPGGSGRAVRLRGYEEWTFDAGGKIRQSLGHYDEAEYQRQVRHEP
jgi:steroid delta-isomerase-like uncharacterized protein